jgi:AbrB family looped-hinge helix DNA binding protein
MASRTPGTPTALVVSSRGQITLPKPVRARLRLAPGSVLLLREEAGKIVLDPAAVTPVSLYLSSKDRPLLAAAIVAHATHFVTGDVADFGRWMDRRARLPLRVMTPRQFLTEVHP